MSEPQSEYRIQPLKRMAKVYQFPTLSRFEVDELTYEQKQEMRDQQALAVLRAKARLEANIPPPWHKRLAKWYDEVYEDVFEGFGPGLYLIVTMFFFLAIFVQLGKLTGWWGGSW